MEYLKVEIDPKYCKRGLRREIQRLESSEILPVNKEVLLRLKDELSCSDARKRKYLQQWRFLAKWLDKPFRETDKRDIQRLVNTIKSRYPDDLPRNKIRAKTRRDYKQALKLLYTLLEGEDGVPPMKVAWVKTGLKKSERMSPISSSDMLTVQDRIQLIESARYHRDKALIACLCDGLRPDELLYMRVGDIQVEDDIAWAQVTGYKGSRRVDFIWATPFLLQWIDQHPFKDNPFAPLWVHIYAKSEKDYLSRVRLTNIVNEVGVRAAKLHGLAKDRIYPYLLRHVRVTELAPHLSDEEMDAFFGWEPGSAMPQIYVHLSGKKVGNKVKRLAGIAVNGDEEEDPYKIKRCLYCKRINQPAATKCYHCHKQLDDESCLDFKERRAMALRKLQEFLVMNPEIFEAVRAGDKIPLNGQSSFILENQEDLKLLAKDEIPYAGELLKAVGEA